MTGESMPTIIITMAGGGRRFREVGHTVPKFRIEAGGQSLFAWSMESLRGFIAAGCPFVFIAQRADEAGPFITAQAKRLGIVDHALVEIEGITDGQATTVLAAAPNMPDARGIIIYNIDTHVAPQALPVTAVRGDGWIPCFPGEGEGWSFARCDEAGPDPDRVLEVREKQRISPHATVGLYYFSSLRLYRDAYERHYSDPINLEKGERYIAPLYNRLVRDGRPVFMHRLPADAVHPLGVPAEVARFVASGRGGGME